MGSCIWKTFLFILTARAVVSEICPAGCSCGNGINCVGLSTVPSFIGSTQSFVNIYRSTLSEIPPNAFYGNPNLKSITIYEATIGRMRNCAFQGLSNPSTINISMSSIDTIESGAFNNINFDTDAFFGISSVSIGTIESYAFSSIISDKEFSMSEMNVTTIKPFAFHSLSLKSFSISSSNINLLESSAFSDFSAVEQFNFYLVAVGELNCDTLNKVKEDVGNAYNVNRLYLNCTCNIAWLVSSSLTLEPSVMCIGPPALAEKRVRDLNVTTVCPSGNFSRTCPKREGNLPDQCPSTSNSSQALLTSFLQRVMFLLIVLSTYI